MTETQWLVYGVILFSCLLTPAIDAHREHKVHNIVLYPDKHSWCNTTPIKQVVAYPGCNSVEIDNNVCVGACFSYSIPHTSPSAPGELIKPYCDSCQPSQVTWQTVTLDCNGEEMTEKVQMIENCSCSACESHASHDDLATELQSSEDDDIYKEPPFLSNNDLMKDFMNPHNPRKNSSESTNHTLITNDPVFYEKLLLLLKQFNGEDSVEDNPDLDKSALQELLKLVEGVDHRVNQVTLGKLVKHVEESEHIKVDITSLRHFLSRFAHEDQPHRHHHHHSSHHHGDPTLDVASHLLKPAVEDTVLSYHEQHVEDQDLEER